MSIENTLAERGNRYGDFTDHADLAQGIQFRMQRFCLKADNEAGFIEPWKDRLNNVQRQALTVISDKIARILSGDPNYADNWHDIQGYAKLVEDRLPKPEEPAADIDDDSPRQQAVAQNGNTGEHYDALPIESTPINPDDAGISTSGSPAWKDAPDWAQWLAQDSDGQWNWFEYPICADEDDAEWYEQEGFDGMVCRAGEAVECNPEWRTTAQARPTK